MTVGFFVALAIQSKGLALDDFSLLVAVYFILLQLALVVGVALFFSCISTSILSPVFTFCIFVIGNFLGDIRAFGQESGSPLLEKATALLYYLLPNFNDFNVIDQVAHRVRISGLVITANTAYALLYIAILLSGAVLIFEEREFK
jgi:ABC-type transport system involved in multi-copper enzyme maturation permease subunit